ncbi:MAG: NAD-dependent dehydratase [Planctomycetes bacterium DG_23]|nr:MAG: NAD-dependent dehydratase [Planctomycetes bacterium DG_23]
MRIILSGGAGFIGSHLADFLTQHQHQVVSIDNLLTGEEENISHLASLEEFEFRHQDIICPLEIEGPVDAVLHFASPASPKDYVKFPIETLSAGSVGTRNLLELAKEKKAVFFLASSSEVYGDPQVHPQIESYWGNVNPIGVRSVYDEAKRFAEALTMAYHRRFGLDTRIARIFNTYGPRMRLEDGRVLPSFMTAALKGEPLTVFGDGSQTRSFCYVLDMVDGIYRLLLSQENEPVNLGNPDEVSIIDFAKEIKALTNSKSEIVFEELPADDPKTRRPDITRAKEVLGWKPEVSRGEGLGFTLPYFKEKLGL